MVTTSTELTELNLLKKIDSAIGELDHYSSLLHNTLQSKEKPSIQQAEESKVTLENIIKSLKEKVAVIENNVDTAKVRRKACPIFLFVLQNKYLFFCFYFYLRGIKSFFFMMATISHLFFNIRYLDQT